MHSLSVYSHLKSIFMVCVVLAGSLGVCVWIDTPYRYNYVDYVNCTAATTLSLFIESSLIAQVYQAALHVGVCIQYGVQVCCNDFSSVSIVDSNNYHFMPSL